MPQEPLAWDQIESDPEFQSIPLAQKEKVFNGWHQEVSGYLKSQGAPENELADFQKAASERFNSKYVVPAVQADQNTLFNLASDPLDTQLLGAIRQDELHRAEGTLPRPDGIPLTPMEEPPPESGYFRSAAAKATEGGMRTVAGAIDIANEFVPETGQAKELIGQRDALLERRKELKKLPISQLSKDPALRAEFRGIQPAVDKLNAQIRLQERGPRSQQAVGQLESIAPMAFPFFGADPRSTNALAQAGRGSGAVLNPLVAMGVAGPAGGLAQMAAQGHSEAYSHKEQELRAQGVTDEAEIARQASLAAGDATIATIPTMGAFLGLGKLAAIGGAAAVGEAASPMVKAAAGTGAALASNIAGSSAIRAIGAEPGERLKAAIPTIESFTMDTLFAGYHGLGEFGKAIMANGDTGTVRTPIGTVDQTGKIVEPGTPEGVALRAMAGLDATKPTEVAARPVEEIPIVPVVDEVPVPPAETQPPRLKAEPSRTTSEPPTRLSAEPFAPGTEVNRGGVNDRVVETFKDTDGTWKARLESDPETPVPISEVTRGHQEPPLPPLENTQPPWPSNDPVGIRNEFTEAERVRLSFPDRADPIARSFPQLHAEAEQAFARNRDVGRNLVEQLKANPRAHTGPEAAVLTFETARQQKLVDRAYDAVNSARTPEELAQAQADLSTQAARYQDALSVSELSGTQASEALYARRMIINEDFSLARMLAKERATKPDAAPLTPSETAEVTKLYSEIKAKEQNVAKVEAKKAEVEEAAVHKQLLKTVGKEAKASAKQKQDKLGFFERQAQEAEKRIIARRGRLQTGDPLNIAGLVDEAIIGASYIAKGVKDFGRWSQQMLSKFGERVRPVLQELFGKSQQIEAENSKPFRQPNPQEIIAESDGEITPKLVGDLWLSHIRSGKTENADIRKAVTTDLQAAHPDLTERQVQEIFTQYGKQSFPSKEADKAMLREHKTLERINLQIDDLNNNVIPKKTGAQRDKASVKVRELGKQRDALMRKLGINPTDPATQLASAHTARVSRLKNTIEELQKNLAEGKRTPEREGVPWTPDELALQDQVNILRDQLDSVLNSPENAKIESLIKRISAVTEKLMTGNLEGKPKIQTADTASVARLKETLKGLNKELIKERRAQHLRENPPATPDEKRLAALERTRDDLALRVADGDTSTKTGRPTVATLEQATVMQEIEGLQKVIAEMRRAERPAKVGDEAQLKNLERRLAAAQAKVASGDFGPASRKAPVDTARVAEARAKLEAVNQQIAEARAAVRNSPEARLARAKEASLARQKAIQARIDANDYAPPAKQDKVMDRELLRYQFDENRLKEEWQNRAADQSWARKSVWAKTGDILSDTPNLARILITSADGPAIFRQTLTALTSPNRTARSAWRSMRAMFSEEKRFEYQRNRERRKNAPLYEASGLRVSKANSTSSKTEEQYISRLLHNLPSPEGNTPLEKLLSFAKNPWEIHKLPGPLLRAAERSFSTYMSEFRTDMFDAMYKLYKPGDYELKEMASVINDFTGSATLPKSWEAHVPFMSKIFFAARKTAADIRVATLMPLIGKSGTVKSRTYALENYARLVGSMGLILGMAKLAGLYYETDPRNTHFGQVYVPGENGKIGVWHDAFSGPAKAFVMASRAATGQTKTDTGKVDSLITPKYGGETVSETVGDFFANKMSPALSNAKVLLNRREWGGKPITAESVALRNTVPISWQQLKPILERLGIPKGFASQAFQFLGGGAQPARVKPKTK